MYKLIRTLLPVLAAMIATTVSAQSVSWKSSVPVSYTHLTLPTKA